MEHDDIDEDIERLNIILQDEDGGEDCDSDGELRVLEKNGTILYHVCKFMWYIITVLLNVITSVLTLGHIRKRNKGVKKIGVQGR